MASLLAMGLFHHSAFAQEGETKLPSTIEAPDESAGQGQNTADEQSPSEGTPPSEVKSGVTGNGDMTDPNNPFNIPRFTLKSTSAYSAYQRGFYLTAFALATKQAGLGDIHAQTLLGELYLKGNGVEQDMKEAANWFEIAAEKGDREAQFNLGMLYAQGQGVPKDFEKALDYFQKAAAKNQPNAQFNLGLLYLRGQLVERDLTKAMDLLNKSAKQGDAAAQYALASLYQSDFFPAPNLEQASYWMQKSAEGGFLDAQLEYGLMLFHGKGVEQNFSAARAWLKQAADAGNILAQNRLARILARGYGQDPDPINAAKYYLLSKRSGKNDEWLEKYFKELPDKEKQLAIKALGAHTLW